MDGRGGSHSAREPSPDDRRTALGRSDRLSLGRWRCFGRAPRHARRASSHGDCHDPAVDDDRGICGRFRLVGVWRRRRNGAHPERAQTCGVQDQARSRPAGDLSRLWEPRRAGWSAQQSVQPSLEGRSAGSSPQRCISSPSGSGTGVRFSTFFNSVSEGCGKPSARRFRVMRVATGTRFLSRNRRCEIDEDFLENIQQSLGSPDKPYRG